MRQQKKTQFLIIFSIILIFTLILSVDLNSKLNNANIRLERDSVTLDERNIKSNNFWSITSIHIDGLGGNGNGTWTWAKTMGFCTGNGNWSDPYIIENISANANGGEFCIKIENSKNFYFIIRNCSTTNAGTQTGINGGIVLYNTCNGTLYNNTCFGNLRHGIVLNSNCKNNTIIDNKLTNNNWHGISLWSNSNNNTIIFNKIVNDDNLYGTGIYMTSSCNYNNISKNKIDNIYTGIAFYYSCNDNIVQDNNFTNNGEYSILLVNSLEYPQYRNIFIGNLMYQSGIEIWGTKKSALMSLTLTKTNLLNDKPICYYVNETYLQPNNFSNAGQIFLVNCNHSKISGLSISNSINGLTLFYSVNNTISQNAFNWNDDHGLYLYYSDNNTIYNNDANNNGAGYGHGIYLEKSDFNNISENRLYNNYHGIWIYSNSEYNYFYNNTVRSSISYGILVQDISPNYISKNNIIGNTVYDNNYGGIGLLRCSYANISGNTLYNNNENGIRISSSFNINIIGNNASLSEKNGIFLSNSDNIYLYNNSATFNSYNGNYLENTNNSEIIKNNASNNALDGINLYRSHHNVITNSTANSNTVSGITLIESNYNLIENNSETISRNGNYGILLENSHYNNITKNYISYHPIGIYIENSYNNLISNNIYVGNEINILYVGIINGGLSGDNGGNGQDNGDIIELPIIIIIIIIGSAITISSISVRIYVKRSKKISAGKLKTQQLDYSTEDNSAQAKKERMLKYKCETKEQETSDTEEKVRKEPEAYKKKLNKGKKAIETKSQSFQLTKAEKAELAKTEAEMEVDKQRFICAVHRGPIYGKGIYLCKHCETFYCERCAKVLKIKGEKCWNCENEIEIEITDKDRIKFLDKKAVDLIDEIINESDFLKEFIETNKNVEEISQIRDYFFSLITLEELDKLDLIELASKDKKRFIKEFIYLDSNKRAEFLDEIFKK